MTVSDTRGHKHIDGELEGKTRRSFMRALLNDLRALERMLQEDRFERGVSRIGAEQELFLVDRAYHPAPGALDLLQRLDDPHFTTELGLFNLEINADPQPLGGDGLARMEAQLAGLVGKLRGEAEKIELTPVLAGILPTIGKGDLGLDNMVPNPRYLTLSRAMNNARGEAFDFSIRGLDDLTVRHDSVMVEACNASFQVHLQLADPDRFAQSYNLAQLLLAPVLASSTNASVLFGRRLWAETRIALFEQACDIRTPGMHLRESAGRVSFGQQWLRGNIHSLYRENIARFRALVGAEIADDPFADLDAGRAPELKALRLHNGTVYRWNRGCYGISENGQAHLRIELRVLPSGPTIADEVASGALWLGLMSELGATVEDVTQHIDFDHARANLYAAARSGLGARLMWLDGEEVLAQTLLLDHLLPAGRVGAAPRGRRRGRHRALPGHPRQARAHPAHRLTLDARLPRQHEEPRQPERPAHRPHRGHDRAAEDRRRRRRLAPRPFRGERQPAHHLPQGVAAHDHGRVYRVPRRPRRAGGQAHAVGAHPPRARRGSRGPPRGPRQLPLDPALLDRACRRGGKRVEGKDASLTPVSDIMRRDVLTVTPDTRTLDAIRLMRRYRIGCLPVVQDGHLVAILTEEDFHGDRERSPRAVPRTQEPAPASPLGRRRVDEA
jgi:CBS domain-containing protein